MKVDELLKRLENIKIDERHEIIGYLVIGYLVRKISVNDSLRIHYYIMTKDKKIYDISSYRELLKSNKISPNDAYVYTFVRNIYNPASYYLPFLVNIYLLPYVYLSKLGLEEHLHRVIGLEGNLQHVVPATGLKYVVTAYHFPDLNHIVVEVADIDTVAINTNLPTLIHGVLGTRYIDNHKVDQIGSQLNSQKLFSGYDFNDAWSISNRYYEDHDTSLTKEVEAIKDAYNRIFQPYRVVYDLKTKQFVV